MTMLSGEVLPISPDDIPFAELWGDDSPATEALLEWLGSNDIPFQLIPVPENNQDTIDLDLPAARLVIGGFKGLFASGPHEIRSTVFRPLLELRTFAIDTVMIEQYAQGGHESG